MVWGSSGSVVFTKQDEWPATLLLCPSVDEQKNKARIYILYLIL